MFCHKWHRSVYRLKLGKIKQSLINYYFQILDRVNIEHQKAEIAGTNSESQVYDPSPLGRGHNKRETYKTTSHNSKPKTFNAKKI